MWCIKLALRVSYKHQEKTCFINWVALYTLFSLSFNQNQVFRVLPALLVVLHTFFVIGFLNSLVGFQKWNMLRTFLLFDPLFAAELYICIWKSILNTYVFVFGNCFKNKKRKEKCKAVIYSAFVNIHC